jgi:ABC-2 type transport system permease protein
MRSRLAGQTAYQLRLFLRSPRALVAAALTPLVLMALLAAISDHRDEPGYMGRLAASMATLGLASMCYTTLAASVVASRDAGVLKRLFATPLPLWVHLTGRVLATVAVTIAQVLVVFLVAVLAYGAPLPTHWNTPVGLVVGAVAVCAIGLAVAQVVPRGDAAATLLSTTLLPVVLVSGVFFPTSELPGWVGRVAEASPLTHVGALLAGSSGWAHYAWLAAWTLAALAFTRWRFRVEPSPVRQPRQPRRLRRFET